YIREFDEAIKCYNQAIMLNSDSPDSWHNKGMTFEQLGKNEEAISCFDTSIKLKKGK
ncbi:MAG: tetratricopeptide repeat protein, partial [Thaumarchaeota archaeon]|nr:tetratricopeptide repeat protein [Nitrososphaerota archaeon]